MKHDRRSQLLLSLAVLLGADALARASDERSPAPALSTFPSEPASVERFGPAYRYPQAGWIVLHIEGEPYERGVQHGRLMAPEIAEIVRAAAVNQSPKAPDDGWSHMRLLVDALFLRRYEDEYLLEMKGIADGAAAAGAKFEGRPVDLVDIVAVNAWTEIEFLDVAMQATPHGLEGIKFRDLLPMPVKAPPPERCSSFIATGPATADGKIVFGHITMWSLQPARHFNVWLDLKPAKGHRVLMQSFPGGIQSTMDYYMNDAGMLVSETTISQTRFNADGQTESSRIRKALQYGSSIDQIVEMLRTSNNGLYSNEWLIGDTKTNEIAMFELGTHKSRLWRSSKNEWFGGTPGFYWGCNNTKDLDVRLETLPSLVGRPANVVFRPTDRDLMWQRLYAKQRGKIDATFGFEAFTTSPLAAAHSLDAKFTTTDMAQELKTYAIFGPPLGRTWEPTDWERGRFGDNIRPLISNGWTLLEAQAPPTEREPRSQPKVVDLASSKDRANFGSGRRRPAEVVGQSFEASGAAWHGTILPKSDADVWLAAAFADYERVVANELSLGGQTEFRSLAGAAVDTTNLSMFPYRSRALAASGSQAETALANVRRSITSNDWYEFAVGKGVFVLSELRSVLGDERFIELMDSFGREFAGKPAATDDFRVRAERAADQKLDWFFDQWTHKPNVPRLRLRDVKATGADGDWHVQGAIDWAESTFRTRVELAIETASGPVTHRVDLRDDRSTSFEISASARPRRLVVDPCNRLLKANGGVTSLQSFERELEHSLIVCGTGPEHASHREAAELLQRRIATQWSNYSVPIKSDRDVTDEDLKSNHLLLVGRPTQNSLTERFRNEFRVELGRGSFAIADQTYAHPDSAVIAAATNPANPRFSLVVFAGLGAESTRRVAQAATSPCEVMIWLAGGGQHSLVLPARDLIVEFATTD